MPFPASTPSAQGVEPGALLALLDGLEAHPRIEPHGLLIQRHGHRVLDAAWAPHRAGQRRLVYSLSKTFTGTALALQIGEGLLSLDDLVADHLPELFDGADERTRTMRIRHIASMASGHDHETLLEASQADADDPVRGFFRLRPEQEPGSIFAYNQPPVLALAAILERRAGQRLVDYLRPRLLEPLGIADLRWWRHRRGTDLGYSGVYTDLDAIGRLGQLYLDDGCWEGRRLLPEGWVADASSLQVSNADDPRADWCVGYGFQLWMSRHGYRGDGAYGQYMVVLPEHDMVIAVLSCCEPMGDILDLCWDLLLPALHDGPLPESGDAALAERVAGLALPTAAERLAAAGRLGTGTIPAGRFAPGRIRGRSQRSITAVEVDPAASVAVLDESGVRTSLPLTAGWTDASPELSSSAAVDADGRLVVDVVCRANPHRLLVAADPADGTFSALWPDVPLFGAGLGSTIATMREPAT